MIEQKKFKIKNMHCTNCEKIIERRIKSVEGVENAKIDYKTETGEVVFNSEKVNIKDIFKPAEEEGYKFSLIEEQKINKGEAEKTEYYSINKKISGLIFGAMGILIIGFFIFRLANGIAIPQISQNMGYGLLFLVGLLTGFHCIAMCGGFVVGYTAKDAQEGRKSYKSHLIYGAGKTLSYTIIGAGFGLLGSIITFTPNMRGIAGIVAGLFLVIFGINMLGFNFMRGLRLKTPAFLEKFIGEKSKTNKSPFIVGLFNGLMIACGPLQAIYIMAAGTGSVVEGAKILFIFALGTLPVMLSFGFLTSFISAKATTKILKFSGVVVILLGLVMMNRGLALTGNSINTDFLTSSTESGNSKNVNIQNGYQIIKMDVTNQGWEPNKFILKKNVPVKWVINGKQINGCNNAIIVPKLNLNFKIRSGEQTIEFTPTEEGVISWSCWMGMIKGTFLVVNDVDLNDETAVQKQLNQVNVPKGGSCGSGGGCGCGGAR